MDLLRGQQIAQDVMMWLGPACERITVAGSIRRQAPEVKDVEIVAISKKGAGAVALFKGSADIIPEIDQRIDILIAEGQLAWDTGVRRNGPRYKRLIHCNSGVAVDLFLATEENWGAIMAIRTGPQAYVKMLVSHGWDGGVMPPNMKQRDGYLWRHGMVVPVPTEADYFREIGVQIWPPEDRHPGRLRLWMKSQAAVARFE
jgi:DNA polymerase/3'-5' exonuclease PolX